MIEGCGWTAGTSICCFCGSETGGGGHTLSRWQNEGARRLGPNVCYNNGFKPGNYCYENTCFSPFYIWPAADSLQTFP